MFSFGDIFGGQKRKALTPEEVFTRTDEDLIACAEAVKAIAKTEGFRLLFRLVEERRREIGSMALQDETHPKEWWKGFHSGTSSLKEMLEAILERAGVAKEELEAERGARSEMRTSGGDFAI